MVTTISFVFGVLTLGPFIFLYWWFSVRYPGIRDSHWYPVFRYGFPTGALLTAVGISCGLTLSTWSKPVTTPLGTVVPYQLVDVAVTLAVMGAIVAFVSLGLVGVTSAVNGERT